ncbi:MAG: hypothetical protein AAF988_03700 [Pseudomonadota bacterium]
MKRIAIYSMAALMGSFSPSFAAGEEAKGGLPQFDPTWFASQVFWLAIAFAVLYIFFAKKTLPDISAVIENRKNHIQSDLEMAEKLAAKADTVQESYNTSLVKAQDKAAKEISKVEDSMKAEAEKAAEEFRLKSDKEIQKAEANIIKAQDKAMDDMNDIAAEITSIAVAKITGTKEDIKTAKSVVNSLSQKETAKAEAA